MGKSLMDRAKELLRGKGVLTTLAIAPLAVSTAARADSIFSPVSPFFNGASGGGLMGHIGQSLFSNSSLTGVLLSGDTKIDGLIDPNLKNALYGDDPIGPSDYVSAAHVFMNSNQIQYRWGQDFDPENPFIPQSMTGQVTAGANFMVVKTDFNVGVTDPGAEVSWDLTYRIHVATPTVDDPGMITEVKYELLSNAPGATDDLRSVPLPTGDLLSWSVALDLHWALTGTDGQVGNINPLSRLEVDMPFDPSGMYIAIDGPTAAAGPTAPGAAAPLPATVWTCGSLLGLVGFCRLRKSRRLCSL